MNCRHCGQTLEHDFVDLGFAPPSNAYLRPADLRAPETYYPLRVKVCDSCWLVQTEDYARADELFNADYAYFSSTSTSWLEHAERYARTVIDQLQLGPEAFVVEVAANDGYLLKNFVAAGVPCLGIEPTESTAAAAADLGIPIMTEFFGEELGVRLAEQGRRADLVVGNNVYAHVPDINDFTKGIAAVLKPEGTVTLEFPHLVPLIDRTQFDTIYHEHFSYLSLTAVTRIFDRCGLRIWDVEELQTHGGSLRVFGCHSESAISTTPRVGAMLAREYLFGIARLETYTAFQSRADNVKDDFLGFLLDQKRADRQVVGYGAAAKGNTLLNYAGVKPDLLHYVCDAASSKQGKFMPGSHIPIYPPQVLFTDSPDYVVILPWNIASEVRCQLAELERRGTRFVTVVPELHVF